MMKKDYEDVKLQGEYSWKRDCRTNRFEHRLSRLDFRSKSKKKEMRSTCWMKKIK